MAEGRFCMVLTSDARCWVAVVMGLHTCLLQGRSSNANVPPAIPGQGQPWSVSAIICLPGVAMMGENALIAPKRGGAIWSDRAPFKFGDICLWRVKSSAAHDAMLLLARRHAAVIAVVAEFTSEDRTYHVWPQCRFPTTDFHRLARMVTAGRHGRRDVFSHAPHFSDTRRLVVSCQSPSYHPPSCRGARDQARLCSGFLIQ